MQRLDDYQDRRKHLKGLSEEELEKRFWELAEKIMDPVLELASKNTSPSIERSVLLRMGFSSIEATGIVDNCVKKGLLGKGAGHVVIKLAKNRDIDYLTAGKLLAEGEGWDEVETLFQGGGAR